MSRKLHFLLNKNKIQDQEEEARANALITSASLRKGAIQRHNRRHPRKQRFANYIREADQEGLASET